MEMLISNVWYIVVFGGICVGVGFAIGQALIAFIVGVLGRART